MKKEFNVKEYLKSIEGVTLKRASVSFHLTKEKQKTRGAFDIPNRLVEFSLSSETPYMRYMMNEDWDLEAYYEILGHKDDEVDLSRLTNGSNLWKDHNTSGVCLAVIEDVKLRDAEIIEIARFSKNPEPSLVFDDIVDKIRSKISVGYHVTDMIEVEKINGIRAFRCKWMPFESSVVGVAADDSIGIGRNLSNDPKAEIVKVLEAPKQETPEAQTIGNKTENLIITEVRTMADEKKEQSNAEINSILAMGKQFKRLEKATEWIEQGKSADSFKDFLLSESSNSNLQSFVKEKTPTTDLGLSEKEKKEYNIMNIVRYLAGDEGADAGFEKELSQEISKKQNKASKNSRSFFVPSDIIQMSRNFNARAFDQLRAMNAGTTTAGGHTVATILEAGSMIDVLRNSLAIGRLGATYLTGLQGIIEIPRVTVATTGSWVAENGSAAEGSVTMDKVTMSQKTATGHTTTTRLLRSQSSIDVNNFVLNELFKTISVTIDSAGINGTGSSNQPTGVRNQSGINTVATDTNGSAPTFGLFVDMETAIANDNADQGTMKYLINSKTRGAAKKTPKVSALDHYIYEKGMINDLEAIVSNQVPSNLIKAGGSNLSTALCGYWPDLLIGLWGSFEISIDDKYYATDGRHRIVAFQDYDVAVRHGESFCEMSGIITT